MGCGASKKSSDLVDRPSWSMLLHGNDKKAIQAYLQPLSDPSFAVLVADAAFGAPMGKIKELIAKFVRAQSRRHLHFSPPSLFF